MRFKLSDKKWRYVRRFALLPIQIGCEVRWLEMVYIYQTRVYLYSPWLNDRFVTKEVWLKNKTK